LSIIAIALKNGVSQFFCFFLTVFISNAVYLVDKNNVLSTK